MKKRKIYVHLNNFRAQEKINSIFNNKKDYCAYFDATQSVHYLLKVNFKNFSQYYQCSRKVFDENNN